MSRMVLAPTPRFAGEPALKPIGALLTAVVAGLSAPPEAAAEPPLTEPVAEPATVGGLTLEQAAPERYAPFVPDAAAEPFADPPVQLAFDL